MYFISFVEDEDLLIGRLLCHFMQVIQFNSHMIESVYDNRVIAPDAETRMWKNTRKFNHGEFVETTRLGGGVYPTMANVNHSCDPNFMLINYGNKAIAVANRKINPGDEIHDTYGAVYFHMDKSERRKYLQVN